MSSQSWVQTLIAAQVDGTALTNTLTATSIIPPAARFTLPANVLQIGSVLRLKSMGRISTLTAAPGTLTLDIRLGGIVVFNGGAMTLNVTAQTNATWRFEALLTMRAIGNATNANAIGVAEWKSRAVVGAGAAGTTGAGVLLLPDTAPVVGTGFDSTVANVVDHFATWSVANAANSIQVHEYALELMN